MKAATSVLLGAFAMAPIMASAQTCAAPLQLSASVQGDTCSAANELGTLCIFAQSPANDIIYTLTVATPYTATSVDLANNTPTWNAAMVLLGGPCNGNTVCTRNADAGGPGVNEDLRALSDGTYFLIVTSTTSDTSWGSYALSVNGTPVMLQSFDII